MKYIKLFDGLNTPIIHNKSNKLPFSDLYEDDITTHLIDDIDRGEIKISPIDIKGDNDIDIINKKLSSPYPDVLIKHWPRYLGSQGNLYKDINIGRYSLKNNLTYPIQMNNSIIFEICLEHPFTTLAGDARPNTSFGYENYAISMIKHYFKRFHNNYDVDIFYSIELLDRYSNPFCKIIIVIQDGDYKLVKESKSESEEIEKIEDYFLELIDHKDDNIPIKVKIENNPTAIAITDPSHKMPRYKIEILFDFLDQEYIRKFLIVCIKRLKRNYNIHSNQILKSGNGGIWRKIKVYGTDRDTDVFDPYWKRIIIVSPKNEKINESLNSQETNLIIVDVQPSFKKFFTKEYVEKLKEYAKTFTNVYQIWDNHHEGKNVDKDYLYDDNPDMPDNKDLYTFNNQKKLVEKRYQYDVDVNYYQKILDENTYIDAKNKEAKGLLRRGDIFLTTQGTAIVYVGNNHNFFHISRKMYKLFLDLKGKEVIITGGSSNECLLDIETAAKSIGVIIKRNEGYIYSGSYCPIK